MLIIKHFTVWELVQKCNRFFLSFYRGSPQKRLNSVASLPSRHITISYHCHCLCDAIQIAFPSWGVSVSEISSSHHLAEFEFHGSTLRVGAESHCRWPLKESLARYATTVTSANKSASVPRSGATWARAMHRWSTISTYASQSW